MAIQDNPFYLLNVSCSDDRRKIAAAVDEISFEIDPETAGEAQNRLLNMEKRLISELNWFPAETPDKISEIRGQIQKKSPAAVSSTDLLSQINISRYNFSLLSPDDSVSAKEYILAINEQFQLLDENHLMSVINQCRSSAKMVPVSIEDMPLGLNTLRTEIRQEITSVLTNMDLESYRDTVASAADHLEKQEDIILMDLIDEYEICIQSKIDEITNDIETLLETVKQKTRKDVKEAANQQLLDRVEEFGKWVKPLQIKSTINGIEHQDSLSLCGKLREYSAYLYETNKKQTLQPFFLIMKMKQAFANSGLLSNRIKEDLDNLTASAKANGLDISKESFFENMEQSVWNLQENANNETIGAYLEKIKTNKNLLEPIEKEIGSGTTTWIQEALCQTGRETALDLHNNRDKTDAAYQIIKGLKEIFETIPACEEKLQKDLEKIYEIRYQRSQPKKGIFSRIFTSPYP